MLQWLTDGEPTVAVLEFVTVGTDHTAFLSGSVKGGGRHSETSFLLTVFQFNYDFLIYMSA